MRSVTREDSPSYPLHNGEVSFWWRARGGFPARRPSLPGPEEADVCIVGAGYTGLWTAYYLRREHPGLKVVVLEAAFAGFGASGRNGGWVTAEPVGSREKYARGPAGTQGVAALEAALRDTVDEIAGVCATEEIDCGFIRGGRLSVATTPAQLARLRAGLEAARAWGDGEDVLSFENAKELPGARRRTGWKRGQSPLRGQRWRGPLAGSATSSRGFRTRWVAGSLGTLPSSSPPLGRVPAR